MSMSFRETEWARWLRAAALGDEEAYRRFLTSIAPHIRAVVHARRGMLGDAGNEVEDIVQEVLLTIHLKRGTWDPSRPIGPWISAIARNKLVDIFRRSGRHRSIPIEDVMDSLPLEDAAPEFSGRDVDRMLDQLKAQQKEIVRSISLDGISIKETADRLHMTEGAVRVALHRALKTLAALYRSKSRED